MPSWWDHLTVLEKEFYTFVVTTKRRHPPSFASAFSHACQGCPCTEFVCGGRRAFSCDVTGFTHLCYAVQADNDSAADSFIGDPFCAFTEETATKDSAMCTLTGLVVDKNIIQDAATKADDDEVRGDGFGAASAEARVCKKDLPDGATQRPGPTDEAKAKKALARASYKQELEARPVETTASLTTHGLLEEAVNKRVKSVLTQVYQSQQRREIVHGTNYKLDEKQFAPGFETRHLDAARENAMAFLLTTHSSVSAPMEFYVAVLYMTLIEGTTLDGFFPHGRDEHLAKYALPEASLVALDYVLVTIRNQRRFVKEHVSKIRSAVAAAAAAPQPLPPPETRKRTRGARTRGRSSELFAGLKQSLSLG